MQPKRDRHFNAQQDVHFIRSECVRFHQLFKDLGPKDFFKSVPHRDLMAELTLPSGRMIICGVAALRRLQDLATRTLSSSYLTGTVDPEGFYLSLKRIITERFIAENAPVDGVESALLAALDEAQAKRGDFIHFIPCRLIDGREPSIFDIGPVRFYARDTFKDRIEPLYAEYVRRYEDYKFLPKEAQRYYEGFSWIAEVKILQCDQVVSKERAILAARGALDVLHVLLGSNLTERMAVGGPRLADDVRAHLHLDAGGELDISLSRSATSEVGFGDQLSKFFVRDDVAFLIGAAADAIAPLVDPGVKRPLGLRLIDAFAWFGDAAREQSDAARIIKATNSLERLFATRERKDGGVTKTFSRRGAAICYGSEPNEPLSTIAALFVMAYEIRSALTHGGMSPFDPEVVERAPEVMHLARRALSCALGLFKQANLIDGLKSDADFAPWLDKLAADTEMHDSKGRGTTRMLKADNEK